MIIWLTGISGAGKTTLAKNLLNLLKMRLVNLVGVDGDEIRTLFGNDLGYHVNDRIKQIKRIQTLTKFLDKQAKDIMTKNPKIILDEMPLLDALSIMTKNKITCLFISKNKSTKKPIGIIHIHDCLRLIQS